MLSESALVMEHKKAVSLSSAVFIRHNNQQKLHGVLATNSKLPQPRCGALHVHPLIVATMPTNRTSHSGGQRGANNFSFKKYTVYSI